MADKTPKTTADILTHLSNVLPTGTFLVFQVLAPLATNNGDCHKTEKVVTGAAVVILSALCFFTCYTDSYKTEHGTLYYGLVTSRGLWNPNFKYAQIASSGFFLDLPEKKYKWRFTDFVNAAVSVVTLLTLSLLTAPVTTCFYPNLPSSVQKTVPVLVGLVVSVVCAFGTNSRHGIGFAPPPHPVDSTGKYPGDST
jgi:ABC-type multidrug transport system fused ATPase/permease subunit